MKLFSLQWILWTVLLVEWFDDTYLEFDGRYRSYAVQATYALIDLFPHLKNRLSKLGPAWSHLSVTPLLLGR